MNPAHSTRALLPVTYQDWNLPNRKARGEAYGEAEAGRRYDAHEGFWILFGDPSQPQIVVELERERFSVRVAFLDVHLRCSTSCLFVSGKYYYPDLLLLEQHRRLSYDRDDAWNPASVDSAWVRPEGRWYRRQQTGADLAETRGLLPAAQLSDLIEPFPAFGDWAGITRLRTFPPALMTSTTSEQAQPAVALSPQSVLARSGTQPAAAAAGAAWGLVAPAASAAALDRLAGQVNQLAAASGAAAFGAGITRGGQTLTAILPDGSTLPIQLVGQELARGIAAHASTQGVRIAIWSTAHPHAAAVLDELAALYGAASPRRPAGRGAADSDAVWLAKLAGLDTAHYYLSKGQPHVYPNALTLPNGQPVPALAWTDAAGYHLARKLPFPDHRLSREPLAMTRSGAESPPVIYQGWNPAFGEPHGEEYGEAEARRRYEAREGFWVLFGDPDRPRIVVEFEGERYGVKVAFLDELLREATNYFFEPGKFDDPDLMLLSKHRRLSYDTDDAWSRWSADAVWFAPDRRWYRNQQTRWQPLVEVRGAFPDEQLAELTEPFPVFGDWTGITRPRQLPPGPG